MSRARSGHSSKHGRRPAGFEKVELKIAAFEREMREAENETTQMRRSAELLWPILRITHLKSRYVYQMFIKHKISKEVLDYCIENGYANEALIKQWKIPGFEHLCCLNCIQNASQFGKTCMCRVPLKDRTDQSGHVLECKTCGCRGCSGAKKTKPAAVSAGVPTESSPNHESSVATNQLQDTNTDSESKHQHSTENSSQ